MLFGDHSSIFLTCTGQEIYILATPVRKARRLGMLNIPRNRCQVFVLRLHSAFSSARWMNSSTTIKERAKRHQLGSILHLLQMKIHERRGRSHLGRQNSKKVRQKIRLASHGLVPYSRDFSLPKIGKKSAKHFLRAFRGLKRSLLKRAFSLVNDSCGQGNSNKNYAKVLPSQKLIWL